MIRPVPLLALVFGAAVVSAQAPVQHSDGPRFEVASVKPLPVDSNRSGYRPDPTRFSGAFSVATALAFAYQVPATRIVAAPSWATEERYEINAITGPRKPGDLQAMMRHLLEKRFALKVHRERRPIPVYVLLRTGSGGLGPNLRQVERDCTRPALNLSGCSASFGADQYRSRGQDWSVFVGSLETRIGGRPVLDRTGLSGQFDITLEWDPGIPRAPEGGTTIVAFSELETPPALFTALREQLGLKIESDTAPMDVIVVDSVDRPTPD